MLPCYQAAAPTTSPQYPPDYREFAYVTNGASNTVTVLDLVNLRRDREIPVGDDPTGVADLAHPQRGLRRQLRQRHGLRHRREEECRRRHHPRPPKPYFIDVSADGHRGYVANSGSNNVSVLDLDRRKEIATIGVGEAPGSPASPPTTRRCVVTNRVCGSVTVIDGPTLKVRSVFAGCPGATDAVILPDSSKAFIACSGGHQVMVLALARKAARTTE